MHPSPALPITFLEQYFPPWRCGWNPGFAHVMHAFHRYVTRSDPCSDALTLFHQGLRFSKSSLHFQFYLSCTGKISPDVTISSRSLQALPPLPRGKACGSISLPRLPSGVNRGQRLCALVQRSQLWIVTTSSWALEFHLMEYHSLAEKSFLLFQEPLSFQTWPHCVLDLAFFLACFHIRTLLLLHGSSRAIGSKKVREPNNTSQVLYVVPCGDKRASVISSCTRVPPLRHLQQENEILEASRHIFRIVDLNIVLWEKFVTDHHGQVINKIIRQCDHKIKTSAKREGKNLPSSDSPVNAIQFVIKVTCQNNCFSLNIYSNIWKVFNGHHLHGKWQEIREKSTCLQMDRCWIPSPAGRWTSLPSLGSLLISVCFTAPRREKLSAGAGESWAEERWVSFFTATCCMQSWACGTPMLPPPCTLPCTDYWPL